MPPEQTTPAPLIPPDVSSPTPEPPARRQRPLLTKEQLNLVYVMLGSFLLSSLGAGIAHLSRFFYLAPVASVLLFAWYIGALIGSILIIGSFFAGLIDMVRRKEGGLEMFLSSFVIGLVVAVVGTGTCMFNLSGAFGY